MKKIISVVSLSVILLFTSIANAETKIATVDVLAVLQQMPQREALAQSLDSEFAARTKTMQDLEKKANDAAQKLKKDGMTLSASEKTKLQNIITSFEDKAKEYTLDYRKREGEEANKLLEKIQAAVIEVAKKEQYDLILKAETAFYVTDAANITDKVIEQVKK